ncbi:50S ribosomal protein L11 methyltransferase [Ignatzschineria ureiclastica]|uniref:Ribosomal protein L11 methyltransferase n=1 Tax=Ignatzschineria ureiclastica TaxID=472582 RepID=A0A2U2ACV1_9GAMM|nr:50S ribosomal protein L11 methyltransferase [Ignatzschineria ureiclastica]PWD80481.1 50S ribosomal protein L11 methyltransferase [Ignatzschineria ureiclastica]GGZ99155.1 ribosomal protein L11 methyltransferase [Ignatzschineria ureiclastica]
MNRWFELTLKADSRLTAELLDEALVESGAVAVTMKDGEDEPIFEPLPGETPLWRETLVTGLYEEPCDVDGIIAFLSQYLDEPHLPIVETHELEDKDWVKAWQDHYKPIKFGPNLWICPTHLPSPEPEIATVRLDPGLAFGTGTHPTTALCLEWLSENQSLFIDQIIIDYGCGSGILGIAGQLLGAKSCYSTDIDPQAIYATEQNAERNNVEIVASLPEGFSPPKARVVLSNILSGPLVELAPILGNLVEPGGHLVLAGLLDHDAEFVKLAYRDQFVFEADKSLDGWTRLYGIKKQ